MAHNIVLIYDCGNLVSLLQNIVYCFYVFCFLEISWKERLQNDLFVSSGT